MRWLSTMARWIRSTLPSIGERLRRFRLPRVSYLLTATAALAMPFVVLWLGRAAFTLDFDPAAVNPWHDSRTHDERMIGQFHESNRSFPDQPIEIAMQLFVEVPMSQSQQLQTVIDERHGSIQSAVSEVLRVASHQDLREPTLTTLKRKVKVALIAATGAENSLFEELIIPEFDAQPVREPRI